MNRRYSHWVSRALNIGVVELDELARVCIARRLVTTRKSGRERVVGIVPESADARL